MTKDRAKEIIEEFGMNSDDETRARAIFRDLLKTEIEDVALEMWASRDVSEFNIFGVLRIDAEQINESADYARSCALAYILAKHIDDSLHESAGEIAVEQCELIERAKRVLEL